MRKTPTIFFFIIIVQYVVCTATFKNVQVVYPNQVNKLRALGNPMLNEKHSIEKQTKHSDDDNSDNKLLFIVASG